MRSINFEFLRTRWPVLAELGGFAETYAHTDATGAITKLRTYCEQFVEWIHHDQRLPKPYQSTLNDLLANQPFRDIIPDVILAKLHALRREGNRSIHCNLGDISTAISLIREAFDVGRWLHVTYANGKAADYPPFQEPTKGGVEGAEHRREKRAYLERISTQELQLKQLLQDLAKARSETQEATATAEDRKAALEAAIQAQTELRTVDPLSFDEAATRRYLIDQMLANEGWLVGNGDQNTDHVTKAVPIKNLPGDSPDDIADYVLLGDNGRPLAVIEAKRTAKDPQAGRIQAKLHADALEQEYGQRPIIFFTNGYDLWIWNDYAGEPWRRLYGFYSRDSLQRLIFQRTQRRSLSEIAPNPAIAGRMYQIEAVRRVVERFAEQKRKALIVQATGTGKTRVAISLSEAMIRAGWAKRVLFLCDRLELRKQAANAFADFLPSEPATIVTGNCSRENRHRIYLSTYPAMMKVYDSFDAGFFDLIIADESHRSLYNRYRQLLKYFDCYQVGLTATPIDLFWDRNTFTLFDCEEGDPTFNFTYEEAINHCPPYLVPFEVDTHTTKFLRDGIKYSQMTPEQQLQLEEHEELPQAIECEQSSIDKTIFNLDTNRHILRNLMDNGIRAANGNRIGKSIIFARSKEHARLLEKLFYDMYPQYGDSYCRAIVSDNSQAESLIDDFKGRGNNPDLAIAISVDMLDTGIDVPEVVNLVFAKPIYSHVKFWQMIGRGTRLCPDLFGPDQHKTHFQIFDHWGNFERFEHRDTTSTRERPKSLGENVFAARIELAAASLDHQNRDAFDLAVSLIRSDIAALPTKSIAVREKRAQIDFFQAGNSLKDFSAATKITLQKEIAPLMQWVDIKRQDEAWKFDRLIAHAQTELLRGSSKFNDLRHEIVNLVSDLQTNLSQVRIKLPFIDQVQSPRFWDKATVQALEGIRNELRGIVQYRIPSDAPRRTRTFIDVTEDESRIESHRHKVTHEMLTDLDMVAYRNRIHAALQAIFDQNETLQRIKRGETVSNEEIERLCSLVLTREPGLDLHHLADYFPEAASLDQAIRSIIGMDAEAVHERFEAFVHKHPDISSHANKFLQLLQQHIARYGSIEIGQLYEPPFTSLHSEGPDGLFGEHLVDELLDIINTFSSE